MQDQNKKAKYIKKKTKLIDQWKTYEPGNRRLKKKVYLIIIGKKKIKSRI